MSSNTGSGPTYRHEHSKSFKEGGVKFTVKEELKYGELGLSFRFLQKAGDDNSKFYMINVKEGPKGKYAMTEKKGEKQTDVTQSAKRPQHERDINRDRGRG